MCYINNYSDTHRETHIQKDSTALKLYCLLVITPDTGSFKNYFGFGGGVVCGSNQSLTNKYSLFIIAEYDLYSVVPLGYETSIESLEISIPTIVKT